MSRRGNHDSLDLFVVQNPPVVIDALGVGRRVGRAFQGGGIGVADRDQLGRFQPRQGGNDFAAPITEANHCAFDLKRHERFQVRGAGRRASDQFHATQHGHQGRERAAFEKIAAIQFGGWVGVHTGEIFGRWSLSLNSGRWPSPRRAAGNRRQSDRDQREKRFCLGQV